MPEMPEDPISQAKGLAVYWHHVFIDLMDSGFTREEAFSLLECQVQSYWGAAYTKNIMYGGKTPDG